MVRRQGKRNITYVYLLFALQKQALGVIEIVSDSPLQKTKIEVRHKVNCQQESENLKSKYSVIQSLKLRRLLSSSLLYLELREVGLVYK